MEAMTIKQRDILDNFRIVRSMKHRIVFGSHDLREARFNNGGQFMDFTMLDGKAVTISLN